MSMKSYVQTTGTLVLTAAALLCLVFARDARACNSSGATWRSVRSGELALLLGSSLKQAMPQAETTTSEREDQQEGNSERRHPRIVGMWITDFFVENTDKLFDHAIEQFSSDGNELIFSALVPPLLGDVCFGVWQASGPRAFTLKHIGWTFDTTGNFTGTATLSATFNVDRDGNSFTGSFVSDVLDLSGNVLPGMSVKGVLKGKRFAPDCARIQADASSCVGSQ
jgi:hypothetical protein